MDGKGYIGIISCVYCFVSGGNCDFELIGIDIGKFWDVVGDFVFVDGGVGCCCDLV